MSRHPADPVLDTALRHLDPAPRSRLTHEEHDRAEAAFARIVAADGEGPVPVEPDRPRRRRRRVLVALGLTGASAGVVLPGLLPGGGEAYASWTPTPVPLTGAIAAEAGAHCRHDIVAPDSGVRVAVAERRGGWTYVLLTGPSWEGFCLMPNELVRQGRTVGKDFFGGSGHVDSAPPDPGSGRIEETSGLQGNTEEGEFTYVDGVVGDDVTGVMVHTSSGLDIEASVAGRRFAAWWPSVAQSSRHPRGESWTYSVRLANGSTRRLS